MQRGRYFDLELQQSWGRDRHGLGTPIYAALGCRCSRRLHMALLGLPEFASIAQLLFEVCIVLAVFRIMDAGRGSPHPAPLPAETLP